MRFSLLAMFLFLGACNSCAVPSSQPSPPQPVCPPTGVIQTPCGPCAVDSYCGTGFNACPQGMCCYMGGKPQPGPDGSLPQ